MSFYDMRQGLVLVPNGFETSARYEETEKCLRGKGLSAYSINFHSTTTYCPTTTTYCPSQITRNLC